MPTGWATLFLGVFVRVFLEERNIWISRLSEEFPHRCRGAAGELQGSVIPFVEHLDRKSRKAEEGGFAVRAGTSTARPDVAPLRPLLLLQSLPRETARRLLMA